MKLHRAAGPALALFIAPLVAAPLAALPQQVAKGIYVIQPSAVAVSKTVRELAAEEAAHPTPEPAEVREVENFAVPHPATPLPPSAGVESPAVQRRIPDSANGHITNPIENWEGVPHTGVYPPDPNGAVGPNHYVQTVNTKLEIWNKTGTVLVAATNINSLWSTLPPSDPCRTQNNGDPITMYDQLADRWLISQFAIPTNNWHQCLAISQTGDPTGAYYLYSYLYSTTDLNDYPHFGLWPDGYYMTAHQFLGGSSWDGEGVVVFQRSQMLVGGTAVAIYFDIGAVTTNYGGDLAASLDGTALPAGGAPGHVFEWDQAGWIGDAQDTVRVWNVHVDYNTPSNSTYGTDASFDPNFELTPTQDLVMGCSGRSCIPQPGTGVGLDAISDGRLMYRVGERIFGDHDSVVFNHTVDACNGGCGTPGQAAPHWYELRGLEEGSPVVYQDGIFAPDGTTHRWMASVSMDRSGNIGLGYSTSSSTIFPTINYTGRTATDTLGQMTLGEKTVQSGSGSQTGSASRWGDYTLLTVDPADDCTFWYTNEYIQTTGTANWQTRVNSFQVFPCGAGSLIFADDFELGNTSRWSFTQN